MAEIRSAKPSTTFSPRSGRHPSARRGSSSAAHRRYATRRAGDITYLPESPAARSIIRAIRDGGHEVGLHGSFETYDHGDRFGAQRQRLERITETPARGVRQHYLRMRPGTTQREMAVAGFRYDSTYGFADRNGFRLGLADVVETFDVQSGQRLDIDEVPFVWMDRALSKYRGVESPDAWIDDALSLAAVCRQTEGLWAGIWHPNLTPPLGFPDAPAAYRRLVRAIVDENAHIDTLGRARGLAARAAGRAGLGDRRARASGRGRNARAACDSRMTTGVALTDLDSAS